MIKGIGVDIIEIERIQKAIERWGEHFLNHVFTSEEIAYASKYSFPYPQYAGRFAAKEAIYKALGQPGVSWKDISIVNDPDGKPLCRLSNITVNHAQVLVSISHSKNYAVAQAIVTA